MTPSRTRVVLADDDVLLREGLAGLLQRSGFEIVGLAGDAAELIDPSSRSSTSECRPATRAKVSMLPA
jgi:DNA-binding NarL/FixJ family response regulator